MPFQPAHAVIALALSLASLAARPVSAAPAPKAHAATAKAAAGSAPQSPAAAPAAAALGADTASPAAEATMDTKVYLGKSGSRYHNKGCRNLKGAGKEITIGNAMKQGYAPCNVCKAPRVKR
jgi:hypothetical protein